MNVLYCVCIWQVVEALCSALSGGGQASTTVSGVVPSAGGSDEACGGSPGCDVSGTAQAVQPWLVSSPVLCLVLLTVAGDLLRFVDETFGNAGVVAMSLGSARLNSSRHLIFSLWQCVVNAVSDCSNADEQADTACLIRVTQELCEFFCSASCRQACASLPTSGIDDNAAVGALMLSPILRSLGRLQPRQLLSHASPMCADLWRALRRYDDATRKRQPECAATIEATFPNEGAVVEGGAMPTTPTTPRMSSVKGAHPINTCFGFHG
jgi:hypothetical protein